MLCRFLSFALFAVVGLVFAAAAGASGYGGHGYQGGSYCKLHGAYDNHRNYSYSYDYRYRPKGKRHGYKGNYGYAGSHGRSSAYKGGHGGGYNGGYYAGGCRSVYTIDYWNGRRARIGGTQCFDHYGKPYIVPGSRYVIEYLYY